MEKIFLVPELRALELRRVDHAGERNSRIVPDHLSAETRVHDYVGAASGRARGRQPIHGAYRW